MTKTKQTSTKVQKNTRSRPAAVGRTAVRERIFETDSTYFLKLVVFVLLGTFWLKFGQPVSWLGVPLSGLPVGLLIGLILVNRFEKYQSDRKIWYAILVVITIISYFVPAGIVL